MIEASVTCINTYYARARRHTCTRSDLADWTRSGTGPVDRSHHRANRNGSGTVPLRSHRIGTDVNTGNWNGSGTVPVSNLWCEHGLILHKSVCRRSQTAGRNSCSIISGDVSN